MRDLGETEEHLIKIALSIYKNRCERVAMRGALGDAAALCDALHDRIMVENTIRGRVTKQGIASASIAKLAGDMIFQMRAKIDPNTPDGRPVPKEATDG